MIVKNDLAEDPSSLRDRLYKKNGPKIILGFLMFFDTFLSLFVFLKKSLRLDEAQSLWQTSRSAGTILKLVAEDVHVPLYHLLLHVWQLFLGNNVPTVRIFSLLFFLLSIPSMYALGRLMYNKSSALFGAILFSLSPFMNWYGNEARMYSMFTFFVIVNSYCFIKLYKDTSESDQNGQREQEQDEQSKTGWDGWWRWYAITAFLGIYTHYFFFLLLISQVFFYFFNREIFPAFSLRRFIGIAVALFILFLPWLLFVKSLSVISNSSPQLPIPNSINIFSTFSNFLFGFQIDYINTLLVSLWPLVVLLGFLALKRGAKISKDTIYCLVIFLMPTVIAFVISIFIRPVYLSRYLILTLPPMFLLLTWLASNYSVEVGRFFKAVLIILMLGTLAVEAVSSNTPVNENYQGASLYLEQHASPADIIVVSAPFTLYPVLYYYDGPADLETLHIWDRSKSGSIPAFNESTLTKDVQTLTAGHNNLWLLLSYDQGYQSKIQFYFDTHFQRIDKQNFSPKLDLYEYKLRY
jgi:uncharacterized membrane protein